MLANKNRFTSIDQYIASFPKSAQTVLQKVRQAIQKAAPDATEAISYQMPTFKLNGKNLVHFAGYEHHIGFYPTPSGTKAFDKELSRYKRGKGSVQFPIREPVPYGLVKDIVIFRMKEVQAKKPARR